MSVESDVIDAIKGRFSNRAYHNAFPQPPAAPVWPSARVTVVSVTPDADVCGDGGEETADVRVQIDIVVDASAGYSALKVLQADVMQDMSALDPPAIWDAVRFDFDAETTTHRCSLDYLIYPSSDE